MMKKILVIRRDNIGDLVCTTPLFAALRDEFPDARIDALVNSYNAPVLHQNPNLNHVHVYQKAKHRQPGESRWLIYWKTVRLIWRLRRERFDLLILAKSSFDKQGAKLAGWIQPRQTLGFVAPHIPAPAITLPVAETGSNFQHEVLTLDLLLQKISSRSLNSYSLQVFPDSAQFAFALPTPSAERPYCAVHISAREPDRRWPRAHFIHLIEALYRSHHVQPVLCWSPGANTDPRHPGDDALANEIQAAVQVPLVSMPTRNLRELISGLALCQQVICMDGGALHIAAALGRPIVAMFENRPEKYLRWYPWHTRYEMVRAPQRVVAEIPVEQVRAAHARLFAIERNPAPV